MSASGLAERVSQGHIRRGILGYHYLCYGFARDPGQANVTGLALFWRRTSEHHRHRSGDAGGDSGGSPNRHLTAPTAQSPRHRHPDPFKIAVHTRPAILDVEPREEQIRRLSNR